MIAGLRNGRLSRTLKGQVLFEGKVGVPLASYETGQSHIAKDFFALQISNAGGKERPRF